MSATGPFLSVRRSPDLDREPLMGMENRVRGAGIHRPSRDAAQVAPSSGHTPGGEMGSRSRGRPPLPCEVKKLIVRLANDNPRWGYKRIRGELLKLGHDVSAMIIRNVLRRHGLGPAPRRSGPTWTEFLRTQAHSILASDFFTVYSLWGRTIYMSSSSSRSRVGASTSPAAPLVPTRAGSRSRHATSRCAWRTEASP